MPKSATPALAQWFAIKARHPDALVFFRMGDFFELFFADAEAAAAALDIALTRRGEHEGRPGRHAYDRHREWRDELAEMFPGLVSY